MNMDSERRTDLPWRLWGRRVKPLSLGASLACVGAALGPLYTGANESFEFQGPQGLFVAGMALVAVVCFWVGWWVNSSRWSIFGLWLTAISFGLRATLAGLSIGWLHPSPWVSAGMVCAAGGAWLLERAPDGGRE